MIGHFAEFLTAVTDDPAQHLSLLPILTSNEHQQVIEWNTTTTEVPQATGIHELITGQPGRPGRGLRRHLAYLCGA